MRIVLFFFILPLFPILYFLTRTETKPRKNIILGVTLPYEARQDPDVLSLCAEFRKWLGILTLLSLLSFIACTIFIPYDSIFYTLLIAYIFIETAASVLPVAVFNHKLRLLKQERGWRGETALLTDTRAATAPKKLIRFGCFLPPILISLIPLLDTVIHGGDWQMKLSYLLVALIVISLAFIYRVINRQRADIADSNTDRTIALTRVRRYSWSKLLLGVTWATGLFSLCLWQFLFSYWGMLLSIIVYSAIILFLVIQTQFSTLKAQRVLTQYSGTDLYVDEDALWLWGLFYNNPNDRRFMVNDRLGVGMTVNFAHSAAKWLMMILSLCLLVLPLSGAYLIREEFTPVHLEIEDGQVVALHTGTIYSVSIDSIQSVELLQTLPKTTVKINGTGLANLYKGTYKFAELGSCHTNLNPNCPPFLKLTVGEETYLLGSDDPVEVCYVMDSLLKNYS